MPAEVTIDIASEVPLLIGVVGSLEDTETAPPALGEAFVAILLELRGRYPQTPLVVLSASTPGAESVAIRAARASAFPVVALTHTGDADPRDRIAYASDILVVVSSAAAPAELRAIVHRRRNGEPPLTGRRKALAPPDVGPCYLLEGAAVQRFFPPRFAGDERGEPDFAAELARRNRFNVDLRTVREPGEGAALERLRTRTDTVTNLLQAKSNAWQRALYAIAFLAASVQVVTVIPHGGYIKFGAVAIAFLAYFFVRRQDYQSRYQDYRAISEALRVQTVWSALGVADNVEESYLPMQQTDLQWIRNVLRVLNFLDQREPSTQGFDVVLQWATSQNRYFAEHSRIEARRRDAFAKAAAALGALSVIASLSTLALSVVHEGTSRISLAVGIVAAWSALCVAIARSYSQTRAYSENANRYQRMFFVFDRAVVLLKHAHIHEAHVRTIAAELGREALAEHAEWLLAQRERRISMADTSAI